MDKRAKRSKPAAARKQKPAVPYKPKGLMQLPLKLPPGKSYQKYEASSKTSRESKPMGKEEKVSAKTTGAGQKYQPPSLRSDDFAPFSDSQENDLAVAPAQPKDSKPHPGRGEKYVVPSLRSEDFDPFSDSPEIEASKDTGERPAGGQIKAVSKDTPGKLLIPTSAKAYVPPPLEDEDFAPFTDSDRDQPVAKSTAPEKIANTSKPKKTNQKSILSRICCCKQGKAHKDGVNKTKG